MFLFNKAWVSFQEQHSLMFKQVPQRSVLSRDIVGSVSVPFSSSLKRKRDKLARHGRMDDKSGFGGEGVASCVSSEILI